jgi:hypothetical protein
MPKFLLFVFLLLVSYHLQAQTWEIGGSFGGAGYVGDLNRNPVKPSGASAGIFVKRNFDGYLSAKINFTAGRFGAVDSLSNDAQFRDRNLSFTDNFKELSIIGEFNFMKYIPDAGPNKYTPYIYAGIGITGYTPRANYKGDQVSLREYRTEGQAKKYGDQTAVIPYGIGIKYNIGGKFNLAADVGYRFTFTDYLDDVSGNYPDKSKLSVVARDLSDRSGERNGVYIGAAGTQRGDLKPRDIYFTFGFTISYTFVTQKCYY